MGSESDPLAVTAPDGRVYGVSGLRVADASLFPSVPRANTNIPTIMTAEKIADTIISRLKLITFFPDFPCFCGRIQPAFKPELACMSLWKVLIIEFINRYNRVWTLGN